MLLRPLRVLLLTCALTPAAARADELVFLSTGAGQLHFDSPGLTWFNKSYAASEGVSEGFSPWGQATGARVDLGYGWIGPLGLAGWCTAGFHGYTQRGVAELDDGSTRRLRLHATDVSFASELGIVREQWMATVLVESSTRHVVLDATSVSAAGVESQGPEDRLNGRYEGWLSSDLDLGFSVGVGHAPVYLLFRWTVPLASAADGYLVDDAPWKAEDGSSAFPADYASFAAGGAYPAVWAGELAGWTASINLALVAPVR